MAEFNFIVAASGGDYTTIQDAWDNGVLPRAPGDIVELIMVGVNSFGNLQSAWWAGTQCPPGVLVTIKASDLDYWFGDELSLAKPILPDILIQGLPANSEIRFDGLQFSRGPGNHCVKFLDPLTLGLISMNRCLIFGDNTIPMAVESIASLHITNSAFITNGGTRCATVKQTADMWFDHCILMGASNQGMFAEDCAIKSTNVINFLNGGVDFQAVGSGSYAGSFNNMSEDLSAPGGGSITGQVPSLIVNTYKLSNGDISGAKTGGINTGLILDVEGKPYATANPSMGINQQPPVPSGVNTFYGWS